MTHRLSCSVATAVLVAGSVSLASQAPAPSQQKPRDHMAHTFDDPERYAKTFDDPARDAWQMPTRVIESLGLQAGQAVADIGAGTGYFSVRLAKSPAAPVVYAADIEPAMVAHLRARAEKEHLKNVVAVQASPESPNLPSPVDTVLIVDTYHHIGNRVEYFRRLRSSIKAGGQLAIIDFRKDSPDGPPVEFRFTAEQISAELAQAGYRLAARHDFLPRQLFLVYK
jgi:cyclopropane fatty-acyl-phospholipid synthase-like methyltransferase